LKTSEVQIKYPRITIITGSTKIWFEESLKSGDIEGGYLARFIFPSASEPGDFHRPKVMNTEPIVESLADYLKGVSALSGDADFRAVEEQAWPYFERHHREVVSVPHELQGFWSRINVNTVKLAMLFCASRDVDLTIQADDWGRSIILMDYLKDTIRHLVATVATDYTGKQLNKIRRVVSIEGVDRRNALRLSGMKAKDFDSCMITLVQTGELHQHPLKNKRGPSTQMLFQAYEAGACLHCSRNGHEAH
jgi:hypothetical protein